MKKFKKCSMLYCKPCLKPKLSNYGHLWLCYSEFHVTIIFRQKRFSSDDCAMAQETRVQSQVKSYQRLKKMVLDATLLNTQHYKVRIWTDKERESGKSMLAVQIDDDDIYIYIYIYIIICVCVCVSVSMWPEWKC